MTDYTKLQSRCQRGEATLAGANNLLAECHGALGKLMAENERLKRDVSAGKAREWDLRSQSRSAKESRARIVELNKSFGSDRDQLIADKAALLSAYNAAIERERDLRVERSTLREAVKFAVKTFKTITSSDGSGHADLAVAALRIAGSAMGNGEQP